MAFQESQVPKAGQEPPAKMEDQEDRETVASQVGQVRMVLQESQVPKVPKAGQVPKAGPESPANQDSRENLATMVPLASPVPEVNEVTQVNQVSKVKLVSKVNVVTQVSQVRRVNQVNQVLQVKVTTSQPPTRPRAHPTPLKAVGVAMERAGTGRLTATATAPTKSTTNQWTLWKSNINSIVIQQDLSVLSTTTIFTMYVHMYNVH